MASARLSQATTCARRSVPGLTNPMMPSAATMLANAMAWVQAAGRGSCRTKYWYATMAKPAARAIVMPRQSTRGSGAVCRMTRQASSANRLREGLSITFHGTPKTSFEPR